MPKQKITKEMVVEAAFELAKSRGLEQISVKEIAERVGCSVQPIYSYCENMDGLRREVIALARKFVNQYVSARLDRSDFFRSTGHAYVRLAYEEPYIFRMFVMHEREHISSLDELYLSESSPDVAAFIADSLHIDMERAKMLHLNLLIFTVGIGTILSTASPGIPMGEIEEKLEQAFEAFRKQAVEK